MKRTGLFTLMATAIVGAVIAKNSSLFAASSFASEATSATEVYNSPALASEDESDSDEIANAIVTRSDVDLTFTNDEMYPWTIVDNTIKNGNCGKSYSTSSLTMNYSSSYKTELTLDWRCYNYSSHSALRIFVDGVQKATTSNSSYNTLRLYVEPGQHVILFKDSIGNSTSTSNYSYIKNVQVKEITPLENSVLTSRSLPLTFENDGVWPWTIEDGYVQNTNYGTANSSSKFRTTFTIDSLSVLSFSRRVAYFDGSNYSSSYSDNHRFYFRISGSINRWWSNSYQTSFSTLRVPLEPGTYTVEWEDTIYNSTYKYLSQVRNIQLLRNWIDIEMASSGTLGVEVLYKANTLQDVEMLKVKGRLNSTDWADIKKMVNIVALDLSEATIESVPDNAFEGLSCLSSVILPEGLKTIGQKAFKGTQIFSISIPSTVTNIGYMAFANTRITEVAFKENSQLTTISNGAFYNCTSLSEILMPNTVTSVGYAAFQECSSLRSIRFSDALTTIWDCTCSGCTSLVSLHLPNNLKTIRFDSFYNTPNLRKVYIPSTVNRIYDNAFYNCGIDSLVLPVTLRYLHENSFYNCKNLKYIEMPSFLEQGNSSSTYYYASGNDISSYSRSIYYGYDNNFNNCTSLETVVCQSATPPTIKDDPFSGGRSKSAVTLIVPSFAVVNYKLDSYWYQFGSILEGDDIDYWTITSTLSLTNNRRMNGKPDIDLYDGGKLIVGGAAPMEVGQLNYYGYDPNPACLLNDCPAMTADSINTYYYFGANQWYFFTPTHDVDLTQVYHTANASYVFRYYDGTSRANNGTGSSWKNVDNGKLLAGQGYIFHCDASGYMVMPAQAATHSQFLTTSDVTKRLAVYESNSSANKSWNYVGNPYPAYYDIYYMDFTAPITVWTGSTYKAYSIADDNYVLRPMQAFFVQKPDAVDEIIFHKEGRQITSTAENHASYARARTAPQNKESRKFFNLQITDDELIDEMRIVVNEEASMAYELECDASKFMSMDNTVPQLFSLDNNGNNYAINERPFSDGTVALGYFAGNAGFYTISAMRADGTAVLHDMVLNKTVELNEQDYTFYSDATESANTTRFVLTLTVDNSTTSITANTSDKNVSVYAVDGMIVIKADNEDASIYSIDGKLIRSLNVKGTTNVNVNNGSYIIKVSDKTFKTVVY